MDISFRAHYVKALSMNIISVVFLLLVTDFPYLVVSERQGKTQAGCDHGCGNRGIMHPGLHD